MRVDEEFASGEACLLKPGVGEGDVNKVPEVPQVPEVIVALAQLERAVGFSLPKVNHKIGNDAPPTLTLRELDLQLMS